jgi:NAD(P)-dependent dehydrogenase (short-subunit alcohol dehydrogenase family)
MGRIVNVSGGIVASPGSMVGGNVYAAAKAALEAHTRNLAAELAGTGVTVNVYRPGGVDTAMQAWIRAQDPKRIGGELHQRFVRSYADGTLITPAQSAAALIGHLLGRTATRPAASGAWPTLPAPSGPAERSIRCARQLRSRQAAQAVSAGGDITSWQHGLTYPVRRPS